MPIVLRLPILLVVVLTGALLAVAAHEFGHALGGRLGGLRLALMTVGPLRVQRARDGRLRWGWNTNLGDAGGAVVSVGERVTGLRWPTFVFVAGGPAASLAAAAFALALYVWLDMDALTWSRNGVLKAGSAGVLTFGAASLAVAAGTIAPYRSRGLASDGRRLLTLLRSGPAAERHAALFALGGWSAAGRPPRQWDGGVVAQALAGGDDGSFDAVAARYMAYVRALDQEDLDAAGEHVRAMGAQVERAPAVVRPLIDTEAAYFDAAYRGATVAAHARLARAGVSPLVDAYTRRRAEAAVLLAGEDAERGREKLHRLCSELAERAATRSVGFQLDEVRRLCQRRGLPAPTGITSLITT